MWLSDHNRIQLTFRRQMLKNIRMEIVTKTILRQCSYSHCPPVVHVEDVDLLVLRFIAFKYIFIVIMFLNNYLIITLNALEIHLHVGVKTRVSHPGALNSNYWFVRIHKVLTIGSYY